MKIKIKELREKKGLSLDKLAKLSGTSKSYLWELENSDILKPSAIKLGQIAIALGTTTDYLVGFTDDKESSEDLNFFIQYKKSSPRVKNQVREIFEVLKVEK